MQVKLVSTTASRIHERDLTAEQLIVYVARVSNPTNQLNTDTADRLIDYMVRNRHWSPFEMADMTVEIKTSRAIAAQILRHRSFSFQEFSQRYAEVTEFEPIQMRRAAVKNRQSSLEEIQLTHELTRAMEHHLEAAQELYRRLLSENVAKECARMILPLTTATTIYMKGSVRSWIHYLQVRTDAHTQLEHREVANAVRDIFAEEFPIITQALSL